MYGFPPSFLLLTRVPVSECAAALLQVYYKEAVGAFIVFDVTRTSTFEAVQKWKNDLDTKVTLPNGKPVPCVLLANKVIVTVTDGSLYH